MKKILIVAAMLSSLGAYAQGSVNFNNFVPGATSGGAAAPINAPIFDVDTTTKLAGAGFQAQLWAGPNSGALVAIGTSNPFRTGAAAGYFTGSTKTIDTVAPGASAAMQVRAWDVSSGATFADATRKGQSATLNLVTGGAGSPPSLPADLVGLTSFSLTGPVIPEPSTIALGALGVVALLLRRRK